MLESAIMRYWNASFRAPRASFDVLLKDKEGKETSSFSAIQGSLALSYKYPKFAEQL